MCRIKRICLPKASGRLGMTDSLVLCVLTLGIAVNSVVLLAGQEAPKLVVEPAGHVVRNGNGAGNLGQICHFKLLNRGANPLKLVGASPTCGVSVVTELPLTIAGGDAALLSLEISSCPTQSAPEGGFKSWLFTNEGAAYELTIPIEDDPQITL